jgi:hypothetical protein
VGAFIIYGCTTIFNCMYEGMNADTVRLCSVQASVLETFITNENVTELM